MGISGLLPLLKPITRSMNIEEFRDKTIAIDTYCWLHKSAFTCIEDLYYGRQTRQFVDYCMRMVRKMQDSGVKPILVFDGGRLPAKAQKEIERREGRSEKRASAEQKIASRDKEARSFMARCLDVTPEMAHQLIQVE